MKKEGIISIVLFILGFIFEYLYLGTEAKFLSVKFWLIGLICIIAGTLGIILYVILPLLDERAKKNGSFKKKQILKNKNGE